MAKVIDALVVTLGLDPSGYKKGAADAKASQEGLKKSAQQETNTTQATTEKSAKSVRQLGTERKKQDNEERKRRRQADRDAKDEQAQDKKRTDASIDRIKSLGLAAAGVVLGFNTVKGAIEAYLGATNQLANLGRLSPTIGVDVKSLDMLGDAYKQVGGKAEEAGSDIAKLAHAQFSFAINAPDAVAGWMRRLGVNPFDAKGNPRDKLQLQNDIADSLRRKTKDIQTQAMYAREMGMSESFVQLYLVKQASERAKILSDSEKTAKATEASAKAAASQEQSFSNLKNHVKAIGQGIVANTAPGLAIAANAVSHALDNTAKGPAADRRVLTSLGISPQSFTPKQFKKAAPYEDAFAAAERKYGLPRGILSNIAHRESNFDPSAVHKNSKGVITGAGLMQLNPAHFKSAGQDTAADIDTAAKELARLLKGTKRYFGSDAALSLAIASYNDGEGNIGRRILKGAQAPQETRDYVSAVENPTGGAGVRSGGIDRSSVTHVQIDELNVHTRATDATGIAATLPDAIKRQSVVSQANTGMN